MRLQISASFELDGVSSRTRFAAVAALVVSGLVALASLAGIMVPAIYGRETASWQLQALGQDWVNLLLAVPWLTASAIAVLRGSRRGRLLLSGGLVYTAYSYAIYAFAVHFNALFLVYCGALGLSCYALLALALDLDGADSWFDDRMPRRAVAGFEMACAAAFGLLWMLQIVPALVRGEVPGEVAEAGLPTNPVHVLDLGLVLPAMFAGGWLLWQGRAAGHALAATFLGFGALMAAAIAGMAVLMLAAHVTTTPTLAVFGGVLAVVSGALLAWMLRAMPPEPRALASARLSAG